MSSYGLRSPPPPSDSPSRPSFNTESLKTYIKKLLASTLEGASFPAPRDRERTKSWCKEIGDRVKERMLGAFLDATFIAYLLLVAVNAEIQPTGL